MKRPNCPRCGSADNETEGTSHNDRCFHCNCGYLQCADDSCGDPNCECADYVTYPKYEGAK